MAIFSKTVIVPMLALAIPAVPLASAVSAGAVETDRMLPVSAEKQFSGSAAQVLEIKKTVAKKCRAEALGDRVAYAVCTAKGRRNAYLNAAKLNTN